MLSRALALLFGLVLFSPVLLATTADDECEEELQAILQELIDFVDQPAFRVFVSTLSEPERLELIDALAEVVEGILVAFDAECGPRIGRSDPGGLRRVVAPDWARAPGSLKRQAAERRHGRAALAAARAL